MKKTIDRVRIVENLDKALFLHELRVVLDSWSLEFDVDVHYTTPEGGYSALVIAYNR
jgi:hypothetical protein